MKRTCLVIATLLFGGLALSASAQTTRPAAPSPSPAAPVRPPTTTGPLPDTKIGLVDTSAFSDERNGITRYINAVKSVQREFQPREKELTDIQTRIQAIADEIKKLTGASVVDPKTNEGKQEEGERLQRELKYKKEQAEADFAKRYGVVVAPISTDIGKAMDQFAASRGLTLVLDLSKLLPAVLSMNPGMDITKAFIADYNSKNP